MVPGLIMKVPPVAGARMLDEVVDSYFTLLEQRSQLFQLEHFVREDSDNRFIASEDPWPESERDLASYVMDQVSPNDDASCRLIHARPTGGPVFIEFIELVWEKSTSSGIGTPRLRAIPLACSGVRVSPAGFGRQIIFGDCPVIILMSAGLKIAVQST